MLIQPTACCGNFGLDAGAFVPYSIKFLVINPYQANQPGGHAGQEIYQNPAAFFEASSGGAIVSR